MKFLSSILFSLLLFFTFNEAQAVSYSLPTVVIATTTSTLVMNPNGFRTYLIIMNKGSVDIIAKMGSVQIGDEGVIIPAGGSYEPIQAPTNGVWVKTVSGTSATTLIQGQ